MKYGDQEYGDSTPHGRNLVEKEELAVKKHDETLARKNRARQLLKDEDCANVARAAAFTVGMSVRIGKQYGKVTAINPKTGALTIRLKTRESKSCLPGFVEIVNS